MAKIKAFKALRPIPKEAAHVAALPYDVYNTEEASREITGKPLSFLRVDRAETTMPAGTDAHDPAVYQQASDNLKRLEDDGVLETEKTPALYLYELTMDGRSQTGLVCCTSVDEYNDGTIKKHELTRADKEQDRIHHVDACDANTGPIFLTYKEDPEISALIDKQKECEPLYDFTADDGVSHRVWIINERDTIKRLEQAFSQVPNLYIADGHHRCASAARVANMRREQAGGYSGKEEYNYFLSVLFPDTQLKILDYNRVVKDLNGLSVDEFLARIAQDFTVEKMHTQVSPSQKGEFGMYLDNVWYKLTAKDWPAQDPVKSLDVSILYDKLLAPVLGIGDPRTDARIDFVGGIRGLTELERRTHTDMKVAFSMYPTSLDELMTIADNNLIMPPKSTWFEPKLRSGLFIHKLK